MHYTFVCISCTILRAHYICKYMRRGSPKLAVTGEYLGMHLTKLSYTLAGMWRKESLRVNFSESFLCLRFIHVYTYFFLYLSIYLFIHCLFVYLSISRSIYVSICIIYIYIHMYVYIYVCAYTCVLASYFHPHSLTYA